METGGNWRFDEPPNHAAIATAPILDGSSWIALAGRDEDGWQFVGPEGPVEEHARVVCLDCVLGLDGSIAELADLPLGWFAHRSDPKEPWKRTPD